MILQIAICMMIYLIFYLIQNGQYLFSEEVIQGAKEILAQDLNIETLTKQIEGWFQSQEEGEKQTDDAIGGANEEGNAILENFQVNGTENTNTIAQEEQYQEAEYDEDDEEDEDNDYKDDDEYDYDENEDLEESYDEDYDDKYEEEFENNKFKKITNKNYKSPKYYEDEDDEEEDAEEDDEVDIYRNNRVNKRNRGNIDDRLAKYKEKMKGEKQAKGLLGFFKDRKR